MMTTFMTRRELARKIGVSDGTLASRLAQARIEPDGIAVNGSLKAPVHLYLASRLTELRRVVATPKEQS